MKLILSSILSFIAVSSTVVVAFPTAPGSCDSPNPLGEAHLVSPIGATAIADFSLQVKIDGTVLDPATPFEVTAGESHKIELVATGEQFKGFLLKMFKEGETSTGLLSTSDANAQVFATCESAGTSGLAHNSRDLKSSVEGAFTIPSAMDDVSLETTVVITNGGTAGSEYYLSAFKINAVGGPTAAPNSASTSMAVLASLSAGAALALTSFVL